MGVLRIGHVDLRVMDLAASRNHYENVIGMKVTHQDDDGALYLKCWDEWDKYSVVLRPGDEAGLNHIAYKVEKDVDLDSLRKRIEEYGIKVEEAPAGALSFCGRSIGFRLPSGQKMHLFAEKECVGREVGDTNPDPWPDEIKGAGVHWLDHCLLFGEFDPEKGVNKVEETANFLMDALDFSMSERMMYGPDASVMGGAFLFRSSSPHDIAIFGGPTAGFHHMAFYLEDWSAILKAGDIMGKNRIHVESPPNRHGVTRGLTIYFFDPSGIRNETFAGLGYASYPDMPVTTWTPETAQRAYFFHTLEPVETFPTVYSPCF